MTSGSIDPNARMSVEADHVSITLSPDVLDALNRWIESRPEPRPSLEEAVRDILAKGLAARGSASSS